MASHSFQGPPGSPGEFGLPVLSLQLGPTLDLWSFFPSVLFQPRGHLLGEPLLSPATIAVPSFPTYPLAHLCLRASSPVFFPWESPSRGSRHQVGLSSAGLEPHRGCLPLAHCSGPRCMLSAGEGERSVSTPGAPFSALAPHQHLNCSSSYPGMRLRDWSRKPVAGLRGRRSWTSQKLKKHARNSWSLRL